MTGMRRLYTQLNRGPGRAIIAVARSSVLMMRGEPTRVSYDRRSSGWLHRSRGGALVLPEPRGWSLRGWGELTRDVFLRDYVPVEGDIVVELGAGVGTETLSLSRMVGPTGRVVAVEAHPTTFAMLARMIEINDLGNVTAVHAAAVDVPGEVRISDRDIADTQENRLSDEGIAVRGVTLDDVARELDLSRIDFFKSNIEGAEVAALRGATEALSLIQHAAIGCHDFLADETGDDSYRTLRDVQGILKAAGFVVAGRVDGRPWAADYLYASRPAYARRAAGSVKRA